MNAGYAMRLVCLSLALYFVINLAVSGLLRLALPLLLHAAHKLPVRRAITLLFSSRMLPAGVGISLVLAIVLPSYFWFEPNIASERLQIRGLMLAMAGAILVFGAALRTLYVVIRSRSFVRSVRSCDGGMHCLSITSQTGVLIALAGVIRPRLLLSEALVHELTDEELQVVIEHEKAHARSSDNVKRFLMLLFPLALPFGDGFRTLGRQISKYMEWAADDEATDGDPQRALALARALVTTSKMQSLNKVAIPAVFSTLVSADGALQERVERLLAIEAEPPHVRHYHVLVTVLLAVTTVLVCSSGLSATMAFVHSVLEYVFG